jgi:hypothetical protein
MTRSVPLTIPDPWADDEAIVDGQAVMPSVEPLGFSTGHVMEPQARVVGVPAAIRRLIRDGRGGVAIEFAFLIPIAILLTIGSVEVARAVSVQASINQAAKETVRFASVRASASGAAATKAESSPRPCSWRI